MRLGEDDLYYSAGIQSFGSGEAKSMRSVVSRRSGAWIALTHTSNLWQQSLYDAPEVDLRIEFGRGCLQP